jgi:ZIP family zinc transporter
MVDWFINLNPTLQALLGGCFTWGVTALGAAMVFLRRDPPAAFLDAPCSASPPE